MDGWTIVASLGSIFSGLSVGSALAVYGLTKRASKISFIESSIHKIDNAINSMKTAVDQEFLHSIVFSFFYDEHIQNYLCEIFDNMQDSVDKEDVNEFMDQIIYHQMKIIPYTCKFDSIEIVEKIFIEIDDIAYSSLSNFKCFRELLTILKVKYYDIKQNIIMSMKHEDILKAVINGIISNDRKTIFTISQFTNRVIEAYIKGISNAYESYLEMQKAIISAISFLLNKFFTISNHNLLKCEKNEKSISFQNSENVVEKYKKIEKFYQEMFKDTELAKELGKIETIINRLEQTKDKGTNLK